MTDNSRRILVLAERVSPNGGTGSHVAASIGVLRDSGHEVLPVLGEPPPGSRGSPEARVIPGLCARRIPAETVARLSELVGALEPDLIHVQQLPDGGLVAQIREHAPVVYNVHNHLACTSGAKYFRRPGDECQRAHGPGCIPNLMLHGCAHTRDPLGLPARYRQVGRSLDGMRSADAVVAHSRFILDGLDKNEVPRARKVPLFATPPSTPTPSPESGPTIFVGRVTEAKGVGSFLRAAALVDSPIEIVGDGWWLPRARRLARRLGIESRVAFRGWLEPEALASAYKRARIVVVPSHWPEPFGLVGLEAMAAGRPVIGTATGGIPEWLDHNHTGFLVAPGDVEGLADALAALSNRDLAARMGAAGARRAQTEFSTERYLSALEAVYDDAVGHWGSG